nr:MAG TPA: hypothetical protein [Caudoviricetes sp.]DAU17250.1 MAG TPA: hypothetical protein [Caudoviricetes sp.]
MKTSDKEKIAKTLAEASVKIKVGMFYFRVKPLTFMQIYEMGVFGNAIKKPTWKEDDKLNIIPFLFEHSETAHLMSEIFIVCAFRKKWARKIWGRYIRKHLDIMAFNELVKFIGGSFNTNFFLTSITFLTQMKIMTEPKTTPRGQ